MTNNKNKNHKPKTEREYRDIKRDKQKSKLIKTILIMKQAKQKSIIFASMLAGIIVVQHAQGQTELSGTGIANNCASTTGPAGINGTFVGCGTGITNCGTKNTFVGDQAGNGSQVTEDNVALGYKALYTQNYGICGATGAFSTYNVALGNNSLYYNNPTASSSNGWKNVALGYSASYNNTTGSFNTVMGNEAFYYNQTGHNNTISGYQAGGFGAGTTIASSFSNNCFFGYQAGYNNKATSDNVAVGYRALYTQNATSIVNTYNTSVGNLSLYTNNPTTGSNGRAHTVMGYAAGYSNGNSSGITCLGYKAGYTNTASYTTAVGFQSGYFNSSGQGNTHVGLDAGYYNATGNYNTTMGYMAGFGNSTFNYNNNSFFGYYAGYSTQTAASNVAVGYEAGYSLTSGPENVFVGYQAGRSNNTGSNNVCVGLQAGVNITSSYNNTCIGTTAGSNITSAANGTLNTCVGANSNVGAAFTNAGAFGYNAINTQASNTIWLGDATCNAIWVAAGGSYNVSDARFKINEKEEVKGLEFIKKLRPVTYQIDTKKLDTHKRKGISRILVHTYTDSTGTHTVYDTIPDPTLTTDYTASTNMIHSGFIAQEAEKALTECGYNCSILGKPADTSIGHLGINYAEIVVPLVKAVQEQQKIIDSLKTTVSALQGSGQRINNNNQGQSNSETILEIELANNIILYDAEPNPFENTTTIRYFIPESIIDNAYIVFSDFFGKEIKRVAISEKGFGKIIADTQNLAGGVYTYSLMVNDKVIDTKKIVRTK